MQLIYFITFITINWYNVVNAKGGFTMTNLETYFKNSQPLNEYIDGMKTNQDTVLSIYQSFELPEDDSRIKK